MAAERCVARPFAHSYRPATDGYRPAAELAQLLGTRGPMVRNSRHEVRPRVTVAHGAHRSHERVCAGQAMPSG